MSQAKTNVFWISMTAAGVTLLALAFLLVYPKWSETSKHRSDIIDKEKGLNIPATSEDDIKAWRARREEYQTDYDSIVGYYKDTDAELEKWFEGLSDPASTAFTNKYSDEIQKLEKKLEDAGIAVGVEKKRGFGTEEAAQYGFNWEIPSVDQWSLIGPESAAVVRALQKRFWIRERIANVALAAKVKRIRDVRFFRLLHPDCPRVGKYDVSTPPYPNAPANTRDIQNFREPVLPDEHGETITFGFTIDIMYGDLPEFLREFLRVDQEPKLLVNVIGMRTYVVKQNLLTKPVYWRQGEQTEEEEVEKFYETVEPVPVTAQFTCRVIDYGEVTPDEKRR
ncbi:MAG: hypothetical protein ACYTAF_03755 [Planctomycetota bacterium]|jgi:hypothetical protein